MRAHVLLLLALAGCGKPIVRGIATIEENESPLKNSIRAGDPEAEPQLTAGFYPAEANGWRWTRRQFRFVLRAPSDAPQHGAELELTVDTPDAVVSRVGPVTLEATIGGLALGPETRANAGIRTYRRHVPAKAFTSPETLVEVTLDKAVKPYTTPGEDRELGLAMHAAALLPADASKAEPK